MSLIIDFLQALITYRQQTVTMVTLLILEELRRNTLVIKLFLVRRIYLNMCSNYDTIRFKSNEKSVE